MLRGETLERASPRSGLERVMRYMAFDRTICERDTKEEMPAERGEGRARQHALSPLQWKGEGGTDADQNVCAWK